jgi:DNA polymerase III delta prime subunit
LGEAQVMAAFSRETGLPAVLLDDDVPLDLENTVDWFAQHVIGQSEAVQHVVDLLVMIKARLSRPRKPLASFLFIGPTGTGKTEMAKTLAHFLFGDPARLVRFDLNEFSDPVSVQRLIGGCQAGSPEGLLTARIREQPFSVVLLDEFEKADPSFFDLLLQILGDGRLTDAAGRVADFCNSVIVMTSNLGAEGFQRGPTGFRKQGAGSPEAQAHFADAVRKFLRPEIYNRLDAIVPFHALPPDIVLLIARRHLDLLRQRDGLRLRSISWQMGKEVADFLAPKGYHPRYGARPLKRVIERELLVPLAETLNSYKNATPLEVNIGVAEGRIRIQVRARDDKETRLQSESTSNLAEQIVAQRRRIGRLQRSVATSKLEDELTMLESLERRLKAAKVNMPQLQARLAKLPKLREVLAAVNDLAGRAQHLETESLGFLYRREPLESALFRPELDALEFELRKLAREVFRRQHEHPDDIVLAFYSEHRETLMEFAIAYHGLGGELGEAVQVDYFVTPPGARTKVSKLVRETPKKVADFFASPPEKLIGIAMHLRGDLFMPRFNGESGPHMVREKKLERVCLIQSAPLPFEAYEPPQGIERQGAIASRGEIVCRTYEREKDKVRDVILGERPWTSIGVRGCVRGLSEERLSRLIEAATS